jgi:small subunit ribosomal protein S6
LRKYELMLIAKPELEEEGLNGLVTRVQQIMTDHGGQVEKVEQMGRRKLAYTIRKSREGQFVLVHANLDRPAIAELERSLKLTEDVLRYMLVRLDEIE